MSQEEGTLTKGELRIKLERLNRLELETLENKKYEMQIKNEELKEIKGEIEKLLTMLEKEEDPNNPKDRLRERLEHLSRMEAETIKDKKREGKMRNDEIKEIKHEISKILDELKN